MLWRIWLPVAAAAFILTLAWLFVEKRLFLTTLSAGALWAWLSTTAGNLQIRSLEAGTTATVEVESLQLLTMGFALFSLLAFVLHYFDSYPPREESVPDHQPR